MTRTPVIFLIFNRPDTAARVFETIRQARPSLLIVIADGPRKDVDGDDARCRAARAIVDRVDWPCEVVRQYSETNLGCRRRVSSGLTCAFEMVEEAIILEDDCVPDPSFFRFCEELLDHYRSEHRVMHISGDNFLLGARPSQTGYYFSRYAHVWGWATWRRAWAHYDVTMQSWKVLSEQSRENFLRQFGDQRERSYWRYVLSATAANEIDTWDYQWAFTCMRLDGLSVTPSVNLVANIGFGHEATHTRKPSRFAAMSTNSLRFPLVHPSVLECDREADRVVGKAIYRMPSQLRNVLSRFKTLALGSSRWGTLALPRTLQSRTDTGEKRSR